MVDQQNAMMTARRHHHQKDHSSLQVQTEIHAKNKGIADLVGQYFQHEADQKQMKEAGVTPNEVNQMKLEAQIRKFESAQEAQRAYKELSQKWAKEDNEFGEANLGAFNDYQQKQILADF